MNVPVGHPLGLTDDAACELLPDYIALMVNLEQHRKHQPVHTPDSAADTGGQFEWEHGHGPVGKVDAGSPQMGLAVDGAARANVKWPTSAI